MVLLTIIYVFKTKNKLPHGQRLKLCLQWQLASHCHEGCLTCIIFAPWVKYSLALPVVSVAGDWAHKGLLPLGLPTEVTAYMIVWLMVPICCVCVCVCACACARLWLDMKSSEAACHHYCFWCWCVFLLLGNWQHCTGWLCFTISASHGVVHVTYKTKQPSGRAIWQVWLKVLKGFTEGTAVSPRERGWTDGCSPWGAVCVLAFNSHQSSMVMSGVAL